jgi:hypothetical protein
MFIDLLYHPPVTVMAADLVRAARSENDCEPERLRLDNYKNENVKIFIHCTEQHFPISM